MEKLSVENAVIILTVVSGILIIACVIGGYYFWKFHKKNLQQESDYAKRQQELDLQLKELVSGFTSHGEQIKHLGNETDCTKQYNMAMGKLMLEEQKSYLYSVALHIESLVKKNELLVSYGLIEDNLGKNRNSQLLILKGGLQQYADSLACSTQN